MSINSDGFTLIELLIVVAIIGVLALISVPNLLEAQTRSKVAAIRNDLRVLATAIESYSIDNRKYPPATGVNSYYTDGVKLANPVSHRIIPLTTPIGYLASLPPDKFPAKDSLQGTNSHLDAYDYSDPEARPQSGSGKTSGGAWRICSGGPDLFHAYGGQECFLWEANQKGVEYDPTNGTISVGDLVRVGPLHTELGDPNDLSNPNRPGISRVPVYREQF